MKASDLRTVLHNLPHDADVVLSLPAIKIDDVDFEIDIVDGRVILSPLPPTDDEYAVWDFDNNIITWYSLDADNIHLIGGEG